MMAGLLSTRSILLVELFDFFRFLIEVEKHVKI